MTTKEATKALAQVARSEEISKATGVLSDKDIGASAQSLAAQTEVQGAILMAKQFRRDEDNAFERIIRACRRSTFAENVTYNFPRGSTRVIGPSIYFAREMAKAWGNITYGFRVIRDDEELRVIRAYAWDMEHNTRVEQEDSFKKLIQRKFGGETRWVSPDERDLRELTNRRGAILVRNCLLSLMPQDYVDEAIREATATMQKGIAADPDGARKKIIAGFGKLNVKPAALKTYLGIPLEQASPAQLAELRSMYESIRDGHSTWADYSQDGTESKPKQPQKTGKLDPSKLQKTEEKPEEQDKIEYVNADEIEAIKNLQKVATQHGFDITELNEYLKEHAGTAALKKIPRDKFEQVLDWLTERMNELAVSGSDSEPSDEETKPEPKMMSAAQIKRIEDTADNLGIDIGAVKRHTSAKFGASVLEKIPANEETEILAWMAKKK